MKYTRLLLFFTAGILALSLAACGAGQTPEAETAAGEYQTHTFDFQGNIVDVSVDLSGGWDVEFGPEAADLYDGPPDGGRDPVAYGVYESREEYEERLGKADTYTAFADVENGVTFTDSAGVQDYIIDLGDDVYYLISVRPDQDAREIFDRFIVDLIAPASPQAEKDSLYLTLVNRTHKLPENWEDRIELLETQNYYGESIRVERASFEAYQALQSALLAEGVDIELESCYRSVARQEDLWAEYEKAYGLDYCRQYVAVPGFSEHHTGFAIDTNLIQKDDQAGEEEKQKERALLWEKVHAKLPEYGFILRYMEGKDDITGYAYEPWHLRYVGSPDVAREITEKGITLEEYLGQVEPSDATVDYGTSAIYTQSERKDAVAVLRAEFDTWPGCRMQSIRYAGDQCNDPGNIEWMNSLGNGKTYASCIAFFTDFHSPAENSGALDPDADYRDYPWWLARTFGGDWELLTCG